MPIVNGQNVTDDEFQQRGYRDEYANVQDWTPDENTQTADGGSQSSPEDWLRSQGVSEHVIQDEAKYLQEHYGNDWQSAAQSALPDYIQRSQSQRSPEVQDPVSSWSGSGGGTSSGGGQDWYQQLIQQQMSEQAAERAKNQARADELYGTLKGRSEQGLSADWARDPAIRAQADAYSANQERARRNYLSDLAEKSGPYANLQGEARMASERYGQATGGFEANLIGEQLKARRQEISDALQQMGAMLSGDQVRELQKQQGLIDAALQERGLDLGFQQQQNSMEQFMRQLALNEWDRSQYWDATRSGVM